MRQETINIYEFSELSEEAKERAREWMRSTMDFAWMDESIESIKAFCDGYGVTLREWSIGAYSPFSFSTDATNKNFRGVKLSSIDRNDMPTGYCLDADLLSAFYDEFKRSGDALAAFNHALHEGFRHWRDDMEYQLSDEAINESIELNGYEFNKEGVLA